MTPKIISSRGARRAAQAAAALLLCACAGGRGVEKEGFIGANLCPDPNGILVAKVAGDAPAGKAGLQYGDVLLGANDTDLSDPGQRKAFLARIQTVSDKEKVVVQRGRRRFKVSLRSQDRALQPLSPIIEALREALMDGKPLSAAVIVDQVGSMLPAGPQAEAQEWQEASRKLLETDYEGDLLHNFSACDGFTLVDRAEVERVLKELNFQMTGAVSPDLAQQAGRMLGATHILFVGLNRYPPASPQYRYSDATSLRLIEVQSGRVLASAEYTQDN